jgi:predicted transcriptional regulator
VPEIAKILSDELGETVPERSLIAKLSTLGVYVKKQYLTKRGEIPVRKEEYLQKIADILEIDVESLESLSKANKNILILLAGLVKPITKEMLEAE